MCTKLEKCIWIIWNLKIIRSSKINHDTSIAGKTGIKYKSRGKTNQIEESTLKLKGKKAISLKQSFPTELCTTSLILTYLSFDKKSVNIRIS